MEARRLKMLHVDLLQHAFARARSDGLARFLAPDHRFHCDLLAPGEFLGTAGFARFVEAAARPFSDVFTRVESQWCGPDRCATQCSIVGLHMGAIGNLRATHRWPTLRALLFSRAPGDRLQETWLFSDAVAVLARNDAWSVPDAARDGSSGAFDVGD